MLRSTLIQTLHLVTEVPWTALDFMQTANVGKFVTNSFRAASQYIRIQWEMWTLEKTDIRRFWLIRFAGQNTEKRIKL